MAAQQRVLLTAAPSRARRRAGAIALTSASCSSPPQSRDRRGFSSSAASGAAVVNHYTTLGLKQGASKTEIKQKFYELSKNYHPDRNPNNKYATDRFKQVSEAYGVLSDPSQRQQHDSELSLRRGGWAGSGSARYTHGGAHAASGGFDFSGAGNTERRNTANYAWQSGGYDSAQARAQAHARANPFGFGGSSARADFDRFARMARRQAESERAKWEEILDQKRRMSGEGAVAQGAKNAVFLFSLVCLAMAFGSSFSARAAETDPADDDRAIDDRH